MYRPRFSIGFFNGDWDKEQSRLTVIMLLNCLIEINLLYLKTNPRCPLLHESGVYYKRVIERHQEDDDWADIATCVTLGYGDCEDLVCWRVAELRFRGIFAYPDVKLQERADGSWLYHITCMVPDRYSVNGYRREDPSRDVDYRGYFAQGAG